MLKNIKLQATTHRWQHLLNCNTPLLVMERLHSGGRKFVTFDLGSPVLLTDIFIPVCVDWTSATIDVWNGNGKTKAGIIDWNVHLTFITSLFVVIYVTKKTILCD